MLYFGDSVDSGQIVDFCKEAEGRAIPVSPFLPPICGCFKLSNPAVMLGVQSKPCRKVSCLAAKQTETMQVVAGGFGRNCPACRIGTGIKMVEEFVPGNWPSGPYLDHYTDADAPQLNIPKVGSLHLCDVLLAFRPQTNIQHLGCRRVSSTCCRRQGITPRASSCTMRSCGTLAAYTCTTTPSMRSYS